MSEPRPKPLTQVRLAEDVAAFAKSITSTAPADSVLGQANKVREAYAAMAEARIRHVGGEGHWNDVAAASYLVDQEVSKLRMRLNDQEAEHAG